MNTTTAPKSEINNCLDNNNSNAKNNPSSQKKRNNDEGKKKNTGKNIKIPKRGGGGVNKKTTTKTSKTTTKKNGKSPTPKKSTKLAAAKQWKKPAVKIPKMAPKQSKIMSEFEKTADGYTMDVKRNDKGDICTTKRIILEKNVQLLIPMNDMSLLEMKNYYNVLTGGYVTFLGLHADTHVPTLHIHSSKQVTFENDSVLLKNVNPSINI